MSRNVIKDLFDPAKSLLLYILIGNFGLTIASTIMSELILNNLEDLVEDNLGVPEIYFRLIIFSTILLPLLIIFYTAKLSEWLANSYNPTSLEPQLLKATLPGLIVIASKGNPGGKSAAQAAIEHHWCNGIGNLKHCWVICGGQELLNNARKTIEQINFQRLDRSILDYELKDPDNPNRTLKVSLKVINANDVDNPNAIFNLVNKIYTEAKNEGIEESDLIADYTGGTKSMTAGMILACANPQRRVQFMKPGGYLEDGRANRELEAIATEVETAFKIKPIKK